MITNNKTDLDQLRFSARVRRFLSHRDIRTIDQLRSLTLHDVLTGSDMGRAEVAQIAGELAHIGRKWPAISNTEPGEDKLPLNNDVGLGLNALFATSEGDTVELEMTVAGQTVARYDLLGLLRVETKECDPACRANYLRHSANDLRRIADLLEQLASIEPSEA